MTFNKRGYEDTRNKLLGFGCATGLLFLLSGAETLAQENAADQAGEKCIKQVQDYWMAVSKQDTEAAIAMHSPKGIYATNSDGSFHKPLKISSVAQMKENFATYSSLWKVYYPEAIPLSKDVILTRYYLEGLSKSNGNTTPYRTRVTHIWVRENGKWLTRSWHFSGATYGGVHVTQPSDYIKK